MFTKEIIDDIERRLREVKPELPPRYGSHAVHRKQYMERTKQWQREHPDECREYRRLSDTRRKAIELNCEGSHTIKEWKDRRAEYYSRCAYCGKKARHLTKDHIVPLSKSGTNNIDNIVPACGHCNSSKYNNSLVKWKQFKGLQLNWC